MRMLSLLVILCITNLLLAQPRLWLASGVAIEQTSVNNQDYRNPTFAHPVIEPGMLLEFSNSEAVVYWHFSNQHMDIGPAYRMYDLGSGIIERLLINNLRTGPGIRYSPWKNRRLRPAIGFEFLVGVPLKFEYEFHNEGDDVRYPRYGKMVNGVEVATGWNHYLGVEYRIKHDLRFAFDFGFANFSQYFGTQGTLFPQWDLGTVFSGAYGFSHLALIYTP